jgi:hypothetical protein
LALLVNSHDSVSEIIDSTSPITFDDKTTWDVDFLAYIEATREIASLANKVTSRLYCILTHPENIKTSSVLCYSFISQLCSSIAIYANNLAIMLEWLESLLYSVRMKGEENDKLYQSECINQ